MADNAELKYNPDTSASTPDSTAAAPNEPKAPKDRSCPFCGQVFTSSSLGRHLDLYIKPKNPKPPDGVHDVNEIRKLRGGITRRQPRTSLKVESSKKNENRRNSDGLASSSTRQRYEAESKVTDNSPIKSPRDADDGRLHTYLNAANWQATGVINDLPREPSRKLDRSPSGQAHRVHEMRRDTAGNRIQRPEYVTDDMLKLHESAEIGRAAEMALREVLGSLEAAKKRAEPPKVFEEFDFCSLAFPGLCLAMLPPPPTLFSSTPFPVAHTWSLAPPGETQKATLVRLLHERIAAVRNGIPENVPESTVFKHRVHLDGAYEHWETLSESEQSATWNLEVCRAFVQEREKKQQRKDDLESAEQRIRHLEAEYDRLSRFQLPREFLLHPPNTLPVSPAAMREMKGTDLKSGAWEVDYDAEALLNKWRTEVKAVTRPFKPSPMQPKYVETTRNQMKGDIVLNGSVFGVNGPIPRDIDGQHRINDDYSEGYEASRNLGGIVGTDDADAEEVTAVDNVDDNAEEPGTFAGYVNQGALERLRSSRQITYGSPADTAINANGKRLLTPSSASGRSPGPKMYKEQSKS